MRTVFGLDAFVCGARADNLRQSVDVHGVDPEYAFDSLAHGIRPRFGSENPDAHRPLAGVQPPSGIFIHSGKHVGRRNHSSRRAEIQDRLNLS